MNATNVLPSSTQTSTSTRVEYSINFVFFLTTHPPTHPATRTSSLTSTQMTSSTPSFLYNINYTFQLNLSLAQLSPSLSININKIKCPLQNEKSFITSVIISMHNIAIDQSHLAHPWVLCGIELLLLLPLALK